MKRELKFRINIKSYLIVPLLLMLFNFSSQGKDYYMATDGSDANTGSFEKPFASLKKFFEICSPGDTYFLRGGIYKGQNTNVWKSGEEDLPLTICNYPDEVPILDGENIPHICFYSDDGTWNTEGVDYIEHITIEGLIIINYKQSAINFGGNYDQNDRTTRARYIAVRNCVVDNIGQNGITICMADYVTVENCMVSRTGYGMYSWSSGINFYNMTGANNVVRNCISFHHVDVSEHYTDGNGFILDIFPPELHDLGSGVTLENNLFFENGGCGVAITRSGNLNMNNNTLYENVRDPKFIATDAGLNFWREDNIGPFPNINLRNNIIYQSSGKGMHQSTYFDGGNITNNNISGEDGYSYPEFSDPGKLDFTLLSNSLLIDAGTSVDTPKEALYFDNQSIKSQTTDQPMSWYHLAPDIEYIVNKKGLQNCIRTVTRPIGTVADLGAFEYGSVTSIKQYSENNKVFVQNPCIIGNNLKIITSSNDKALIRIFDITGKVVLTRTSLPNNGIIEIDNTNRLTGLYLINIVYPEFSVTQNVVFN